MPTNPLHGFYLKPCGIYDDEEVAELNWAQRGLFDFILAQCYRNPKPWSFKGIDLPAYSMLTTYRKLASCGEGLTVRQVRHACALIADRGVALLPRMRGEDSEAEGDAQLSGGEPMTYDDAKRIADKIRVDSTEDWDAIVNLMDDSIREEMHAEGCWNDVERFLVEYCRRHRKTFGEDFEGVSR